jgi:UDP-3-O-acyl N-acetylglucosamine deacetylase
VRLLGHRYQRTLAQSAETAGIGFLTGAAVRVRFHPAPASSGVVFVRTDLRPHARIRAYIDQVTGTHRRTTLGEAPAQVALVEHVLAALAGLRIDNCVVELNGPEPPGLDGSARPFVDVLRQAGCTLQPARRPIYGVRSPIIVGRDGATLSLHPAATDELRVSYLLNYGQSSPIDRQICTEGITPETFSGSIASCRTFLLETEAVELRRQGLGSRTTVSDLLVFGRKGPIDNVLRFANEPARHKILDLVGDLALFGNDLRGHLIAYRSGHPLNIELVRTLTKQLQQHEEPVREAA